MSKPVLYILCGLPYCGKSTLTKELVKRFGFEVGSVDIQIDKHGFEVDDMTQENWNLVYSEAYEDIKRKLREGKSVLFDMGHLKLSERNTARKIAQNVGANHKLVYINTPKDEIEQRWTENASNKTRGQLSRMGLDKAYSLWQEPTIDENPIIYNQSMDIDKWIDTNIS